MSDTADTARLSITSRIATLHASYRSDFNSEFDAKAFRNDDFYAFQVLERAIRDGSADLKAAAQALEEARLAQLESVETTHVGMGMGTAPLPAAPVARTAEPPPGPERRTLSAGGTGHVRLGNREIVMLSQMRVQYRKTFGAFFDTFEFTGNDLYARTLLALCTASGNLALATMARQFLNDDGTPRFHRRKGAADVQIGLAA